MGNLMRTFHAFSTLFKALNLVLLYFSRNFKHPWMLSLPPWLDVSYFRPFPSLPLFLVTLSSPCLYLILLSGATEGKRE